MQKVSIKSIPQLISQFGVNWVEKIGGYTTPLNYVLGRNILINDFSMADFIDEDLAHKNVYVNPLLIDNILETHSDFVSIQSHSDLHNRKEIATEEIPFNEKANIIKMMAKGKLDDFSNKQIIEILKANRFLNSNTTALEISKYKFCI